VRGFLVLVADVSDRVLAERRARRSIEQYRALAASIPC
jgi:PAS domain-containing protein